MFENLQEKLQRAFKTLRGQATLTEENIGEALREIEQHVLPTMSGAQYLGPEYDPAAMVYRLKFIREGRVTFVDVDARSGTIINRSR